MSTDVLVVIGAGSIGQAIARRTGAGKHLLLADFNETTLQAAATALTDAGHTVSTQQIDVSDRTSVHVLAQAAAGVGDVVQVVSTAGVSPVQAPAEAVLAVDLYGTAVVLGGFGKVIAPGGAGVHISSMAGHMPPPPDPQTAHAPALTPTDQPPALPLLGPRRRRRRWPSRPSTSCWRCPSSGRTRHRPPASPTPSPSRPTTCACRQPPSPGATAARGSTASAPASSSPRWPATRCPDRAPRATRR